MKGYYPNPIFERKNWLDLDGQWEFAFDDEDVGLRENWALGSLPMHIEVPFVYQCEKSGINDKTYHPIVWYKRSFEVCGADLKGSALLSFNGVDYKASVFINGQMVGTHEGGYSPFAFEVSSYLKAGDNSVAVRVEDYHDPAQCRGKQIWTDKNWDCWYTPSTGIWKDVWLSFVGKSYIESCMITPDYDNRCAHFEFDYPNSFDGNGHVEIELSCKGSLLGSFSASTLKYRQTVHVQIPQPENAHYVTLWNPQNPVLYDVVLKLFDADGVLLDCVNTYFGLRKMRIDKGQVLLNNRPLYQRLILDQGYWKDGLLTAPSKEDLKRDLELIKAMGFNGVRMHQKIEDPWFYYYADHMGLVVWAELPSPYFFCFDEIVDVQREMVQVVKSLYNHPSIITWVPFNESWGVDYIYGDKLQQQFVISVFHMLKAMDPNRLVSSNDGWEHPIHDFIAVHDYKVRDTESYMQRFADFDKMINSSIGSRQILANCDVNDGAPVLFTEFGGIALQNQVKGEAWGYNGAASSSKDLEDKIKVLMDALYSDDRLWGFCYTQLTDVQQEVNGLLDKDHNPKCNIEVLRKAFGHEDVFLD